MEWYRHFSQYLTNYESGTSLGSLFRRRRARLITDLIESCFQKAQRVRILDIGGRESYWNIFSDEFLDSHRVHVTLINEEGELSDLHQRNRFRQVCADGCRLHQYQPGDFEFVHSNSVIEHVGSWDNMCLLAQEVQRLGSSFYVQTPNFWFPMEPHFMSPVFHWLPRVVRIALIRRLSLGHMRRQEHLIDAIKVIDSVELLDNEMFKTLFPNALLKKERFLGLPKSLIAYKHPD